MSIDNKKIVEGSFELSEDKKILYKYIPENLAEETVNIPESVTTIEEMAFFQAKNIKNINLPDKLEVIKFMAFTQCINMESVTIPDNVKVIENSTFHSCYNLKKIVLPKDLSIIEKQAFCSCINLESINIPENVTTIEEKAFSDCESLENINLPNSIEYIGMSAFNNCTKLANIKLPANIKTVEASTFHKCENLKSIEFNESLLKIEKSAFRDCISIENIVCPINLTSIANNAFFNCKKLKSVELQNGIEVIETEAFFGCINLESINLPNTLHTIEAKAFTNCYSLQSIKLPSSIEKIGIDVFNFFYNENEIVVIPKNIKELYLSIVPYSDRWIMYDTTKLIFGEHSRFVGKTFTVKSVISDEDKFTINFSNMHQPLAVMNLIKQDWSTETDIVFDNLQSVFDKINEFENKIMVAKAYCDYKKDNTNSSVIKEYERFLRDNIMEIFELFVDKNDVTIIDGLGSIGIIDEDNIDDLIDFAEERNKVEFIAYLLKYQNELDSWF